MLQLPFVHRATALPPRPLMATARTAMLKQRALHRGSLLAAPTRCRQLPLLRAFNSYTDPSQEQQLGHEPAVEPPQAVAWNPENVNHVRLTGTVISQPKVQHTTGSQTVANFLLGLRRRFGRTLGSESVTLEAWGFNSLQAAQHLSPGMRIQVEGQLKENVWTDAATFQEKRKLKVVVDRFYIVTSDADSSGTQDHQHSHDPQQAVAAVQQQRPASPAAAAVPQLQPASMATAVQPRARSLPASLSPSARDMHAMFQQGSGFQQLAAERNVALSTVVDYVIKAAGLGLPLDWARAASELQLGPQDSPWLTGDEVWAAVAAAHAEQFPGQEPAGEQLMAVRLRPIRDILELGPTTMAKLGAQESLAGGKWVSYGAIKLVVAMKIQGVDWNAVITQPPAVLPELSGNGMPREPLF